MRTANDDKFPSEIEINDSKSDLKPSGYFFCPKTVLKAILSRESPNPKYENWKCVFEPILSRKSSNPYIWIFSISRKKIVSLEKRKKIRLWRCLFMQ